MLGYLFYWAFYDISRISKDEILVESISPDGAYTIIFYLSNGGATNSDGIVGELVINETGKKRNIYWDLQEDVVVEWLENNIVNINNNIINLPNGKYDYRHK